MSSNYAMKKDYPMNLMCAIHRNVSLLEEDLPVDWKERLEYCINMLDKNDREVLLRRYRDKNTINEIIDYKFSHIPAKSRLSPHRKTMIQSKLNSIMNEMHRPPMSIILEFGIDEHLKRLEAYNKEVRKREEYELRTSGVVDDYSDLDNITIDETNMNIGAINVLKNKGIITVKELLDILFEDPFKTLSFYGMGYKKFLSICQYASNVKIGGKEIPQFKNLFDISIEMQKNPTSVILKRELINEYYKRFGHHTIEEVLATL